MNIDPTRTIGLVLLLTVFLFGGCTKADERADPQGKEKTAAAESAKGTPKVLDLPTLDDIVGRLQDTSEDERQQALDELRRLGRDGVTEPVGLRALDYATRDYQPAGKIFDVNEELVNLCRNKPLPGYIDIIRDIYPKLKEEARKSALSTLAQIEKREATQAYVTLIKTYGWPENAYPLMRGTLESRPRDADLLFPGFIDGTLAPNDPDAGYLLFLACAQGGLIPQAAIDSAAPHLLHQWRELMKFLAPLQRPDGVAWMFADDYIGKRFTAELLLDVLGYVPQPESEKALTEALSLRDPVLLLWAAASLVMQGKSDRVPADVWDRIAASPQTRVTLVHRLAQLNRSDLFPRQWLKQELLAESNMVDWLCFPTELGRAPDQIELMKRFPVKTDEGDVEIFLFRFKSDSPHWSAKDGWMAGVAGPYRVKDYPTAAIAGPNFTFSQFEKWDAKTPEQHMEEVLDTLTKWYEEKKGNP